MRPLQRTLAWSILILPPLLAVAMLGAWLARGRAIFPDPLLLIAAGLLLVSVVFGILLPRHRLRRVVARLERGAEAVIQDDPAQQLAFTTDPLVERLVVAFDLLSHRLASSEAALQQAESRADGLIAELEEREARMRRRLDAALDAILTLDADDRVLELNPSAEVLFGVSVDEACGRGLDAFLSIHKLCEAGRALLVSGEHASAGPERRELDLVTRAGRRIPAEVTAIAWETPQGRFRTLFLRDLSERRKVQELLERSAQRASVANEAKTRFLASMSHEIRTPLNAILNMNELLLESDLDQEQETYAATASESARALLSIVNSILDFSKIEHDRIKPAVRRTDPEAIAKSAIDLLAARAYARELELTLFCDPQVPPGVLTDPGLVRQILLNLIGNAIRFTDEGEVRLSLFADSAERTLSFAVSDTGVGIAPEAQADLFSEFKRAGGPAGRPLGGSGLGLAISRRFARMLGGDITVSSAPGEGSCFTLSLGFPDGLPEGDRTLAASTLRGWRVALWADNPLLANALARQLRALRIAVALLRPPLPGRNDSCCGELRLLPTESAAPPRVVVLYRVGSRSQPMAAQGHGVATLRMPATLSALLGVLFQVLEQDAPAPSAPTRDRLVEAVERRAAESPPLLLAEDSVANQRVATALLRKVGFQVDVVENGLQAVAAAKRKCYGLVLMDLAMPHMDGIEATGCIRALPGEPGRVPIVALTANAFDEDRQRCFQAGMDGYLSKPVERRSLFQALLEHTARSGPDSLSDSSSDLGIDARPKISPEPRSPEPRSPEPRSPEPRSPQLAEGVARPAAQKDSLRFSATVCPTAVDPDLEDQPIDEVVLASLSAELSEELMPDVIGAFIDEAYARVASIEAAVADADCAAAAAAAHALKGSAATFGARQLRDLAMAMELAGKGGKLDALRERVAPLRGSADATLAVLQLRYPAAEAPPAGS